MINNGEKMELKDKLNLLLKFIFLAVFTYGVISVTCCQKSCQSACTKSSEEVTQCCKTKSISKCGSSCTKPCCGNAVKPSSIKKCGVNCSKPCCSNAGKN